MDKLEKLTKCYSFIMSNLSYCPLAYQFAVNRNQKHSVVFFKITYRYTCIYNDSEICHALYIARHEMLCESTKQPSRKPTN